MNDDKNNVITWKITKEFRGGSPIYLVKRNEWIMASTRDYDDAFVKLRQFQQDESKGETIVLEEQTYVSK